MLDVYLRRTLGYEEALRDLTIPESIAHEVKNFPLSSRQGLECANRRRCLSQINPSLLGQFAVVRPLAHQRG